MKNILKKAFADTLPVLTGYLVLGFGFGIVMHSAGFGPIHTLAMSLFIYAGSMQYAAVGLLTGGASLLTVGVTTLMVNARHLFYGISMLEKYRGTGAMKPYLIFALTDETYSLVCSEETLCGKEKHRYFLTVSLLDHIYWVSGSVAGALAGSLLRFSSEGIDFALTALFVTVFVEQWMSEKRHTPALVGVIGSAVCLLLFGADGFLLPAMLVITVALLLLTERRERNA